MLSVYWGSGLGLLAFEKLIAPASFLKRFKIQHQHAVTMPMVQQLIKAVLKNQVR